MREILCSGQARSLEFPYPGGMAALCWSPAGERGELTVSLHYDGAYGMGEKYNAVNQKGHTAVNEVEEKFCFQGEKTYCPAPFFWTNTGFGLYAATDERTSFRFGEKAVCAELPVDCRVVLFSGMPGEIIRDYMDLFGPAKLPPKWAFGPWISANHWDSQEKVERAVAQAEEHGFPVCALVAEAWSDEATFYVFRGARYVPKPNGGAFRLEDFDFSDSPSPYAASPSRTARCLRRPIPGASASLRTGTASTTSIPSRSWPPSPARSCTASATSATALRKSTAGNSSA